MILYVTSFNKHLYDATGKNLLKTFIKYDIKDKLLITYEDDFKMLENDSFIYYDFKKDAYLQNWLRDNADIIPKEWGGTHKGEFKHKFHKRTSQWFRKIAALHHAVTINNADKIIFLDSDVVFKCELPIARIEKVFAGHSVFYHYGEHRKRKGTGVESGIIGFDMAKKGGKFLNKVFDKYNDKSYRNYLRWDDAWMFTVTAQENSDIKVKDIVLKARDGHVVKDGELAKYLDHHKGIHWRKFGVSHNI